MEDGKDGKDGAFPVEVILTRRSDRAIARKFTYARTARVTTSSVV